MNSILENIDGIAEEAFTLGTLKMALTLRALGHIGYMPEEKLVELATSITQDWVEARKRKSSKQPSQDGGW